MYIIKQKPEDFVVNEIPVYKLDDKGRYSYFWLTKTNYNTVDAVKRIAEKLKIPIKTIGFAGAKDRVAITKQIISIKSAKKEIVESLNLKDMQLEFVGKGGSPISLGDLKGNEFKIKVRNLSANNLNQPNMIPNYFGPQRFSKNNAEIGKLIVKKSIPSVVG